MFEDLLSFAFDGQAALQKVIETSSYGSLEQTIASLVVFAHPKNVAQARGSNIFRIIRGRSNNERGQIVDFPGTGLVMLDDNTAPTDAFVWAHGISRGRYRDIQFNHIWAASTDVSVYTNLANICILPAFLSKLSDSHSQIKALLRYHAFMLYGGWKPVTQPDPVKPAGYDNLVWASAPDHDVSDLEFCYRRAMNKNPRNRATKSARELGWVFSSFQPDTTL